MLLEPGGITLGYPTVVVPLYIYPLEKAWDPLISAAQSHPGIQFLVIINPHNGPGQTPFPDECYRRALRELDNVSNIHPIGYVHCSYGQRAAVDIEGDIDVYCGWHSELSLDGIFIDEVPSDTSWAPYMDSLARHVRSSWQSTVGRSGLVIFNPGVLVDHVLSDSPDYVVAFEQSSQHWGQLHPDERASGLPPSLSKKALAIVHSFSGDIAYSGLEQLVKHIKSAGYTGLYITDQEGGGFTHWPAFWTRVINILHRSTESNQDHVGSSFAQAS